jgi:putative transposase
MKYSVPLQSGKFYHIFNHAVGNENFFRCDDNYLYFLKKYSEYILPIANTYAYVLMPNHFHYLIEIKERKQLYDRHIELENAKENPKIKLEKEFDFEKFTIQQFSNFFNLYSKSFNKKYNRRGALFIDLKRDEINDEVHLKNIVKYIHQNPIHHKFCKIIDEWKYSSYKSIISDKKTLMERHEVLNWFGDLENFIFMHTTLKNLEY